MTSGISCPNCLTGFVKDGTPTGTVTTVHGLTAYVARPEGKPKAVVVFLPDMFGWKMANARLLVDIYAKQGGYLVYLPNIMNGCIPQARVMRSMDTLLAPSSSILTTLLMPFYLVHVMSAALSFLLFNRQSTIIPKLFAFHKAIRNDPETKDLKVASAGFCWGGKYTIHLAQERDLVHAGFVAHPSKMAFPTDWDSVQKPLSMAIGDVDLSIKIDMVKDIKILLEGETKPDGQNKVVIIPGAKHGFAIRADSNDDGQVKSAGEATAQALAWFAKWLD